MKVYLDNNPVLYPTDTLLNPTFTIRKQDENGDPAFSFSGDVEFIEQDYDYIYLMLKTHPNARTNEVILKFVDDCCNDKEYLFKITHESLRWCDGECRVTCTPVEKSLTNEQIICLKNTMIWDNHSGFKQMYHPRMAYCNELRPDWIHFTVLYFAVMFGLLIAILTPILLVLGVIVAAINGLINAINGLIPGTDNDLKTIGFDNNPETNIFQEMKNWYTNLMSRIIGCGRKHPSPLVRSYAQNVCSKCGLQFQSTIFSGSSPYLNTVYVNAPVHKGTQPADNSTYWIEENKPILTGTMFFDQLKPVFNAAWKVKNNTLIFERRDQVNNDAPFLNLTQLNEDDYKICWSWQKKKMYSYFDFKYMKDAVNWIGSEAHERWNNIAEWNNPYNPNQSGAYQPLIQFAACRFRDDGIDTDILTFFENAPLVGNIIKGNDNAMILNSHHSYQPMLLIWNPRSGVQNAKCDNTTWYFPNYYTKAGNPVQLNQFYNYPFWTDDTTSGNLYSFHAIEDPRTNNFKGLEFNAEIKMECSILQNLDIDGKIVTSEGISRELTEIVLNFKQGIITIKGIV